MQSSKDTMTQEITDYETIRNIRETLWARKIV